MKLALSPRGGFKNFLEYKMKEKERIKVGCLQKEFAKMSNLA